MIIINVSISECLKLSLFIYYSSVCILVPQRSSTIDRWPRRLMVMRIICLSFLLFGSNQSSDCAAMAKQICRWDSVDFTRRIQNNSDRNERTSWITPLEHNYVFFTAILNNGNAFGCEMKTERNDSKAGIAENNNGHQFTQFLFIVPVLIQRR